MTRLLLAAMLLLSVLGLVLLGASSTPLPEALPGVKCALLVMLACALLSLALLCKQDLNDESES